MSTAPVIEMSDTQTKHSMPLKLLSLMEDENRTNWLANSDIASQKEKLTDKPIYKHWCNVSGNVWVCGGAQKVYIGGEESEKENKRKGKRKRKRNSGEPR